MNAIWAVRNGPPDVLTLRNEPDPTPRTGEVRVRVQAIGVNYADVMGRMGNGSRGMRAPFVPGLELSGIVDVIAPGVKGLKEGDAVFAYTRTGGYADIVCVPYTQVFTRFPWMDESDGAALPIDYLTAYLCLVVLGAIRAEDTILIHGAHNNVGVAAVHLARIIGARSVGTAPAKFHDALKEQGLEEAIDPFVSDYQVGVRELTENRGADLIINPYLDIHWRMNYHLLAPAGRLINYGGASPFEAQPAPWKQALMALMGAPAYTPARLLQDSKAVGGVSLDMLWQPGARVSSWMAQILDWYDQALFRPLVASTFKLDQAADAHRFIEAERELGKVLLRP